MPHLLLTHDHIPGLRTVGEFRRALEGDELRPLWQRVLSRAERDLALDPLVPGTELPHRPRAQSAAGNRDYTIVNAAQTRLRRGSLVGLVTGDRRFMSDALRQIECLYDRRHWPEWRDLAHLRHAPADLRTGQFMRGIGMAYDWLRDQASASESQG